MDTTKETKAPPFQIRESDPHIDRLNSMMIPMNNMGIQLTEEAH